MYLLLTPGREQGKVLKKIPMIEFRRGKSLKYIFMRAKIAPPEKKKSCCRSCRGSRSKIYKHVVTTKTVRSFSTKREYCIKPNDLNCFSSNVVYLFSWKACSKQYTGSTESFPSRFNNCKSAHWILNKGDTVKQVPFYSFFEYDKYHGMSD